MISHFLSFLLCNPTGVCCGREGGTEDSNFIFRILLALRLTLSLLPRSGSGAGAGAVRRPKSWFFRNRSRGLWEAPGTRRGLPGAAGSFRELPGAAGGCRGRNPGPEKCRKKSNRGWIAILVSNLPRYLDGSSPPAPPGLWTRKNQ